MITQKLINWVNLYNSGDKSARDSVPAEFKHIESKLYDNDQGYNESYDLSDKLWELTETSSDVKLILDNKILDKEELILKMNASLIGECYHNNVLSVKDVFNGYTLVSMDESHDKDYFDLYMKIYEELNFFDEPLKDNTNKWLLSHFTMTFDESTLDYLYAVYLADKPFMLKEAVINRFETFGFYQTSLPMFKHLINYLDDYPMDKEDIDRMLHCFDEDDKQEELKLFFMAKSLGY